MVKPQKLLVIADGPRFPDEEEKCQQARLVIEQVNWECEVFTNYASRNMGCKNRIVSGLNWVFREVHEAIILEDDCLPDSSFFRFAEEMLTRYQSEERVMHIGGTNLAPHKHHGKSYLFSRLVPITGWATWRRAWQLFDENMEQWPYYREQDDLTYFGSQRQYVYDSFDKLYQNKVDAWGGRWAFACTIRNGLSIIPTTNLIRNLGFRADATHTTNDHWWSSIPVRAIDFPLSHPLNMSADREFDNYYLSLLSGTTPPPVNITNRVKRFAARLSKLVLGT